MQFLKSKQKVASVALALGCLVTAQAALADSVYEWGEWEAKPQFKPQEYLSFNTPRFTPTAEQTRIGTNQGNLVTAADNFVYNWVGYSLDFIRLTGVLPDSEALNTAIQPASANDIQLLLVNSGNPHPSPSPDFESLYAGSVAVRATVDGKPFGLDNASNINDINPFDETTKGDIAAFSDKTNEGGFFSGTIDPASGNYNFIQAEGDISVAGGQIAKLVNGNGVVSTFFIGKPISIADLQSAANVYGGSYLFNGMSTLGSKYTLTLNLPLATWSGQWSGTRAYGPFEVPENKGIITGNQFFSNQVQGLGCDCSAPVVAGSVNGTIVGTANNIGVIGKTQLNVTINGNSKVVGDIFGATGQVLIPQIPATDMPPLPPASPPSRLPS